MARLVRGPSFPRNAPTVILGEKAALMNVWVDGQRVDGLNTDAANADVVVLSGSTTRVESNPLSNAAGDVSVFVLGRSQTLPVLDGQVLQTSALCSGAAVRGNLITGYTGVREGIQNSCESAVIENNQIVDVASVGIRVLGREGVAQTSQVRGNLITSAGLNGGFGRQLQHRDRGKWHPRRDRPGQRAQHHALRPPHPRLPGGADRGGAARGLVGHPSATTSGGAARPLLVSSIEARGPLPDARCRCSGVDSPLLTW
jgi:hypothetical protein